MYYGGDLVEIALSVVLARQWYTATGRRLAHTRRRGVLCLGGPARAFQEGQFGAEQTDAVGAVDLGVVRVGGCGDVGAQDDVVAVERFAGEVPFGGEGRSSGAGPFDGGQGFGAFVRRRADGDLGERGVDEGLGALRLLQQGRVDTEQQRDAEGAGDNGRVLVSHSALLAAGLRDLLAQISADEVSVVAAGGTDDGRIGTSYDLVLAAIGTADRGGGVVVLPDLGSSVLTARTVLEDHPRGDVLLVDAPFVEGAVAAAVSASIGADVQAVAHAAEEARHATKF